MATTISLDFVSEAILATFFPAVHRAGGGPLAPPDHNAGLGEASETEWEEQHQLRRDLGRIVREMAQRDGGTTEASDGGGAEEETTPAERRLRSRQEFQVMVDASRRASVHFRAQARDAKAAHEAKLMQSPRKQFARKRARIAHIEQRQQAKQHSDMVESLAAEWAGSVVTLVIGEHTAWRMAQGHADDDERAEDIARTRALEIEERVETQKDEGQEQPHGLKEGIGDDRVYAKANAIHPLPKMPA